MNHRTIHLIIRLFVCMILILGCTLFAQADNLPPVSTRTMPQTLLWPVKDTTKSNITSHVNFRTNGGPAATNYHHGIDIGTGGKELPIVAVASGTAKYMGYNSARGNWVVIDHGNGWYTDYQHLSSCVASKGTSWRVEQGDTIGYTGDTGIAYGIHLHFEVTYTSWGSGHIDSYDGGTWGNKTWAGLNPPCKGWAIDGWEVVDPEVQNYTYNSGVNPTPSNDTTDINKTYRVKDTTTLGLNIRSVPTTSGNSPIGNLKPGVTITCTKRTNNPITGYYWLYGTTSTGLTGWISENMDWIEEISMPAPVQEPAPVSTTTYTVCTPFGMNIRSGAGLSNKVLGYARYKSTVEISEIKKVGLITWGYAVSSSNSNVKGWIALTYPLVKKGQQVFLFSETVLVLPKNLTQIDDEAFEGLSVNAFKCPKELESIGNRAFADCLNMKEILIPGLHTQIADDAFEGVPDNMIILGTKGSTAEEYAKKHGFTFMEYTS